MQDVAGYRVLRSAGHGDRTRLLLGFADGRTVVLKVGAIDDPARAVEIEALSRAAGEHVVGLLDVSSDEHEAVLVLDRLPGGTLADLLDRRGALDVGEAVTILAPLATTLDRIHIAGVAHGTLSLTAVSFRDDGAPTLTGFGSAELFAPGSPEVVREAVAGVVADRAALHAIAAVVLGRVQGEGAAAAHRVAERMQAAPPALVASILFDLAPPTPVRFDADPVDTPVVRLGDPGEAPVVEDAPGPTLPPWLATVVPDGVRERIQEPVAQARQLWERWSPGRRRLVLGAAAAAVTVLLAVGLVPTGAPSASPAPTPSRSLPAHPSDTDALPDDPVEAAVVLLQTREQCLRDLAVLCLDAVVQPGSAAYDDDVALLRAVQQGGEYLGGIAAGEPVLVERLGDSALLDLPPGSDPGSLLLLRTTNGWRIRDYLDAPAVSTGK